MERGRVLFLGFTQTTNNFYLFISSGHAKRRYIALQRRHLHHVYRDIVDTYKRYARVCVDLTAAVAADEKIAAAVAVIVGDKHGDEETENNYNSVNKVNNDNAGGGIGGVALLKKLRRRRRQAKHAAAAGQRKLALLAIKREFE
jgi:hypothetical protein